MGHFFSKRFFGVVKNEVTDVQRCDSPPRMSVKKRKADEDIGNSLRKKRCAPRENFLCPICLDVFTEPVSTPCGHSYCKSCINTYWDTIGRSTCPMCNQTFSIQLQMKVNTLISDLVTQFRCKSEQQAGSPEDLQRIQERREKVECVDMSAASSGNSKDHFLCPLCKEVFTDPVSTPCGHNFCRSCISTHWEASVRCACPTCNQMFSIQHQMKVNILIRDLVSQFRHESEQQAASPEDQQMIQKRREKMKEMKMKKLQQSAVDVTFDPLTAHRLLCLSDDEKQVYCNNVWKTLPDNPERFSLALCVLGKQSFSSGTFYFEVQVTGKTGWILGVAKESVLRKGSFTLNPKRGFWTVCLSNENQYKAATDPPVRLQLKSVPEKVGVFVDYDKGVVSFYDVDAAALIYSFIDLSFTHKLRPFFSPCIGGTNAANNTAPLVICPVNQLE